MRRQSAGGLRARLHENSGPAALVISCIALVLTFTGAADAARQAAMKVVSKPKPGAVLKLGKNGKFPSKAIPKVDSARSADQIGGFAAEELKATCGAEYVDIGTWCLSSATYSVPPADAGKNDFFYAVHACNDLGARVSLQVKANVTTWIAISGVEDASGSFTIVVHPETLPPNDAFADAIALKPGRVQGTNVLATRELGLPDATSAQLWPHRHGTDAMFVQLLGAVGGAEDPAHRVDA